MIYLRLGNDRDSVKRSMCRWNVRGVGFGNDEGKVVWNDFHNEVMGEIDENKKILLENVDDGPYTLKYEDSDNVPLVKWSDIAEIDEDWDGFYYYDKLIPVNIAPYLSEKIGVYDRHGSRLGYVGINELKPEFGERLYRFGLISDVHNEEDQTDANIDDFTNALDVFNKKEDVEFTVICGDLTQNSWTNNLDKEMAIFRDTEDSVSDKTPIYPTTGNHDCPNSSNKDVDIAKLFSYTDVAGIAPSSGAEYSYEITKEHTTQDNKVVTDHFLFLGMKRYEFVNSTYSTSDIQWLDNKLTEYENDRCFVITHMFMQEYAGHMCGIYPYYNCLRGTMHDLVKNVIDSHRNAIWFTGHSHWKWYLQKFDRTANIYPTTSEGRQISWNVHVPSCAYPIDSDGESRVVKKGQSEGAIVDVYENYIDIRAVAFKDEGDETYENRYLPIAQYRLYTND